MRPTPLDRLPQSEVHVQTGNVADELCESVKIINEFAVRHGNWPVTVRGGYTYSGIRFTLARELTVEAIVVWAVVVWACTKSGDRKDDMVSKREERLAMVMHIAKSNKVGRSKERRMGKE